MVNFDAAIKRPFQDFKKLGIGVTIYTIGIILFIILIGLIGSIMSPSLNSINLTILFVSILFPIAIFFFISGYGFECAKTAMNKQSELPEWKNWGNLWLRGFLGFFISLIYYLPIFAITRLMITMNLSLPITKISINLILLVILLLLLAYIIPMAMMFFVDKWKFGAAFKLGAILRKSFTGKYFVAWLVVFVYSLALALLFRLFLKITQEILFISLIFLILSLFLNIAVVITSMTVYGEAYSEIK